MSLATCWKYSAAVTRLRRMFSASLLVAIVGYTALSDGGFFATAWGWPTLACLVTALVAALAADRVRAQRLDLILLAGLAGLMCWSALSALWAPGAELPVHAAELVLVYLAAVTAFLLLDSTSLPIGVVCTVTSIAAYALATRLVPDRLGGYRPGVEGYELATPIGYHNGLGILCALATLTALGLVAHASRLLLRVAAAASIVPLLAALYFTFSRGAIITLLIGMLAAGALERERARFLVTAIATLSLPLVGIWLASRSAALTRAGAPLSAAAHDGHTLAVVLVLFGLLQAPVVVALRRAEQRLPLTAGIQGACVLALGIFAATTAVAYARIGSSPPAAAHARRGGGASSATAARHAPEHELGANLNRRLATLSSDSRSAYWAVAWREVSEHPLLGGGGETFRLYWLRYRSRAAGVLNAHSLYLETLAELGPIGLALLAVSLLVPLVAALRARAHPLVPATAGAYVAALAHAAIDWDWQLPAVGLTMFALAATLVLAARRPASTHRVTAGLRVGAVSAMLALVAFVFVSQVGYNDLTAAEHALAGDRYNAGLADARSASVWLPWAARPWQEMGAAQLATGDVSGARDSFREAIGHDNAEWSSWLGLSLTVTGSGRSHALAQVARLNPHRAAEG